MPYCLNVNNRNDIGLLPVNLFAFMSNNGPPEINQISITVILPRNVKLCFWCYF